MRASRVMATNAASSVDADKQLVTATVFDKRGLMAPIITSTEIARPAEEVFAYVIDPTTMPEWQQGCVSGKLDGLQPGRVQVHDHSENRRSSTPGDDPDHRIRPAAPLGGPGPRRSYQGYRRGHGRAAF